MQEVVVTTTKYPEILVQGQRYDYTSDIVLAIAGVIAAAFIVWRYMSARKGSKE